MIELLPDKYDQLGLMPNEKSFIKIVERAFKDSELAYFALQINPRKKGLQDDKSTPELFDLLVFQDGIVLFRLFDTMDASIAIRTIKAFVDYKLFEQLNEDVVARLKHSRYLTTDFEELKYAFSIKLVFSNIKKFEVLGNINDDFLNANCIFEEDLHYLRYNGINGFSNLLSKKDTVSNDNINFIFQRLCPEITIPRKFFLDEYQKVKGRDGILTAADRSVQAYRLDANQINFINKIGKGNQLVLACAGSGKSVLLVSKCFKLASMNPAEKFLITCYNRNLRDYYNWTKEMAGFSNSGQVAVQTFHELCRYLLNISGIALPPEQPTADEYFKLLFFKTSEALRLGQIKERFYGIFIDEIQIFEPEWYKFCYNLLKSKNDDDHFFVIAGDKSQDIKKNIRKGVAPWQGHGDMYPKYSSRTYAIETNYRNSKPINDAIDKFIELAKAKGSELGADLMSDPELFLRGTAYREGEHPVIIENNNHSNVGEVDAIIAEIKYLIECKQYSETDIAVIFFNKSGFADNTWKEKNYNYEDRLRRLIMLEGWNQPTMLFGDSDKGSYGTRRGISVATIDGALGLDYRAVILAGLHPLGKRDNAKVQSDFAKHHDEFLRELVVEDKEKAFIQNVNYIYTGCTRAKDSLSIVLSIDKGRCVYSDLLREAIGGRR